MNRVLVVEDEKSLRDLMSLMLRKEGYAVEVADSGTQAASRIAKDPLYDLVITDVSMPGMTGLELLRHVRRVSPGSRHPHDRLRLEGDRDRGANEGAAYYVEKPFDLDEMKVVVRKTFDQKRLARENADLKTAVSRPS
jgi:two-component system response regulator PilR (NtrC family)